MTDRPIIFSGPMVCALLEGRKVQTRRILKPQPFIDTQGNFCSSDRPNVTTVWGQSVDGKPYTKLYIERRVRFAAGDRLWVRENIRRFDRGTCDQHVIYMADGACPYGEGNGAPYSVSSRYMPRWASRLTLLVTGVKVERLQDIRERDVRAEGCDLREFWMFGCDGEGRDRVARRAFQHLWESLHGAETWAANPWVAAITFIVHHRNIDQLEGDRA